MYVHHRSSYPAAQDNGLPVLSAANQHMAVWLLSPVDDRNKKAIKINNIQHVDFNGFFIYY